MKKVIIIGAGTMGSGIATWFAQQKISVELFDINEELLESTYQKTLSLWDKLEAKGKFGAKDKANYIQCFQLKNTLETIDSKADLVIEAIVEKLEPKVELFNRLHSLMTRLRLSDQYPTLIL